MLKPVEENIINQSVPIAVSRRNVPQRNVGRIAVFMTRPRREQNVLSRSVQDVGLTAVVLLKSVGTENAYILNLWVPPNVSSRNVHRASQALNVKVISV